MNQLRELASQDKSASQIAGEMGGVTRNAVIGKLNRMGMKTQYAINHPARARSKKKQLAPVVKLPPRSVGEPVELPIEPFDPLKYAVRLIDTEDHHCRWPVSKPTANMLVCGANKAHGFPYCPHHCRIAFNGWTNL